MQKILKDIYHSYRFPLACGGAFFLPLKLSIAYVFIVPLIILWFIENGPHLRIQLHNSRRIMAPFLLFVLAISISSLFGVNPTRSLGAFPSLLFFSSAILVYRDITLAKRHLPILAALLTGQAIAALHSAIDSAFPKVLPRIFLGHVTESGQIALTLLLGGGVVLYLNAFTQRQTNQPKNSVPNITDLPFFTLLYGALVTLLLCIFGFAAYFGFSSEGKVLLSLASLTALSAGGFHALKAWRQTANRHLALQKLLCSVILPLIICALMVNLKRGPWAGVLVGSIVLLFFYARRLIIPVVLVSIALIIAVEPMRTRLTRSSQDFFISGGRSVIWQIGMELSTRFPLGVGFRNSPLLQKYSPEIPPELKHFHNNFINILVEGGWLTLGLYLWWMFSILSTAFGNGSFLSTHSLSISQTRPLLLAIGCAILSWQVAGMVEYNFGDSEVLCIAFLLIGILTGLSAQAESAANYSAPGLEPISNTSLKLLA